MDGLDFEPPELAAELVAVKKFKDFEPRSTNSNRSRGAAATQKTPANVSLRAARMLGWSASSELCNSRPSRHLNPSPQGGGADVPERAPQRLRAVLVSV